MMRSKSRWLYASMKRRTISTFSCDIGLLRKAEIGERTLAVEVNDESRHLAGADLKHRRCLRGHLRYLQPACLTAPAPMLKHKNALVVKFAVSPHPQAAVIERTRSKVSCDISRRVS